VVLVLFNLSESPLAVFQGKSELENCQPLAISENIKELRVFMKELAKKYWQFKRWVFEILKVFFCLRIKVLYQNQFFKKTIHPCWGK
jgi:hypothetical protein